MESEQLKILKQKLKDAYDNIYESKPSHARMNLISVLKILQEHKDDFSDVKTVFKQAETTLESIRKEWLRANTRYYCLMQIQEMRNECDTWLKTRPSRISEDTIAYAKKLGW